jgi:hypothetical protein
VSRDRSGLSERARIWLLEWTGVRRGWWTEVEWSGTDWWWAAHPRKSAAARENDSFLTGDFEARPAANGDRWPRAAGAAAHHVSVRALTIADERRANTATPWATDPCKTVLKRDGPRSSRASRLVSLPRPSFMPTRNETGQPTGPCLSFCPGSHLLSAAPSAASTEKPSSSKEAVTSE